MGSDEQLRFRGWGHALTTFPFADTGPYGVGEGWKAHGLRDFLQKTGVKKGVDIRLSAPERGAIWPRGRQDHSV